MSARRRPRRPGLALRAAALALLAALVAAGCSLPAPAGTSPLRYRDAIFTQLDETDGLTYGSAPGKDGTPQTLTLDMYKPHGDTQTKRPAMVFIHGGGLVAGNSKNGAMVTMSKAFAQRGYVAVSINYRLLGTGNCASDPLPCRDAGIAAQHDAQAAVRWLRVHADQYGIDPTRIGVGGGSAGAVTSLLVGTNSTDPGDSGNPGPSSKVGAAISISGFLPTNETFDAADSPILMFNGTADPVVDFNDGAQTAKDLYNAKVPVVFEALQDGGHVPMQQYGDTIVSQSVYFAYYLMDLAHAAGQPVSAAKAAVKQEAQMRRAHPTLAKRVGR